MEENKENVIIDGTPQNEENQADNQQVVCSKCGAQIGEDQDFCPKCGTPKTSVAKRICSKCGVELQEGQDFCPKCGTKYEPKASAAKKGTGKKLGILFKILIPVITAVVVLVLAIVLYFALRKIPVSGVMFSNDAITINEGETATILYTVLPEDASDRTLTWVSSDESVAKVNDWGVVTAVAKGECKISATSVNGISRECKITVEKPGPNFRAIFDKYCKSTWAKIGFDGSYLSIDTNPYDIDDIGIAYPEAYTAIEEINSYLGLPDSLVYDMVHTTALQGKRSETFNDAGVTVMWTYHPDKGLEVAYKLITN